MSFPQSVDADLFFFPGAKIIAFTNVFMNCEEATAQCVLV